MKVLKKLLNLVFPKKIAEVPKVIKTIGAWAAVIGPIVSLVYWGIRLAMMLLGFSI